MSDSTYSKKLTKKHYFKATVFGLILYIEVEHTYKDINKEGKVIVTKHNEFIKATLSDAFTLGLAHSQVAYLIMFGLIAMGVAYLIVKTLDKKSKYKQPKGKYKNRYK